MFQKKNGHLILGKYNFINEKMKIGVWNNSRVTNYGCNWCVRCIYVVFRFKCEHWVN